ncbi:unnamed protein product [Discula destructiva]
MSPRSLVQLIQACLGVFQSRRDVGRQSERQPHIEPRPITVAPNDKGRRDSLLWNVLIWVWATGLMLGDLLEHIAVWLTGPPKPAPLRCATQELDDHQQAGEIGLHPTHNSIYRFAPGSNITVSIDWASFKDLRLTDDQRHSLLCGLQSVLATINTWNLGDLKFRYVAPLQEGVVQLRYGGNATRTLRDGSTVTTWASTQFPHPWKQRYTVYVYAATFDPQFFTVLVNILSHEFAHLLGMRHYPVPPGEVLDMVEYGTMDKKSIMGVFCHPGDLYFRPLDVYWLQELYATPEGHQIGGKRLEDVRLPAPYGHF